MDPINWKLRKVKDVECKLDESGLYMIIYRVKEIRTFKDIEETFFPVRIDVMRSRDNMPLVSFMGSANAVRKHLIRWLADAGFTISTEHASYIGYELLRAETTWDYVQD